MKSYILFFDGPSLTKYQPFIARQSPRLDHLIVIPKKKISSFPVLRCLNKLRNGVVETSDGFVSVTPLTVTRNGKKLHYVWDNGRMHAVVKSPFQFNETESGNTSLDYVNLRVVKNMLVAVWAALFPSQDSVTVEYWPWVTWRLINRFCSTSLAVFGTQSLLMATGIEARKSLTASIVINWMVKDGIGRIARLWIATNFSKSFDTDIKRARILSMFFFVVCVFGDYLTPLFPSCFLVLAAISNIGRAVAYTAFVSTAPTLHVLFARQENLADLTAKQQAQHSVIDSTVIVAASALIHFFRSSTVALYYLPIIAYGVCTFFTLYTLNLECKTIIFKTLNEHRLVHLTHEWVKYRTTSSPQQVSDVESSVMENLLGAKQPIEVKMGRLEDMVDCPSELNLILHRHKEEAFYVSLQRRRRSKNPSSTILITFREGHREDDTLLAFLAASTSARHLSKKKINILSRSEIACIFQESLQESKSDFFKFQECLIKTGWDLSSIFIRSSDVQQRY